MKDLLKYLREKPEVYFKIRQIYGKTIGAHFFKKKYLEKFGLWNGKKRVRLIDNEKADKILSEKIKSKKPLMVCRYGSNEFRNLFQSNEFDTLCFNAGFFPNNKKLLKKFKEVYFEASKQIDYLCIWNYLNHFSRKKEWIKNFPNIRGFFPIRILGQNSPWVQDLEGKKVLIIHPFKKTIEYQYKRRNKLKRLPKFKKLEIIKAVQTIAGERDNRFETWFDALEYMKKEIDKKDFEIALIGCGAYGLPLAAHIKSIGKQAIHVGGGLQLFFGIKGKRWETLPPQEIGEHWINPLKEDFPKNYSKVEGGCYW